MHKSSVSSVIQWMLKAGLRPFFSPRSATRPRQLLTGNSASRQVRKFKFANRAKNLLPPPRVRSICCPRGNLLRRRGREICIPFRSRVATRRLPSEITRGYGAREGEGLYLT